MYIVPARIEQQSFDNIMNDILKSNNNDTIFSNLFS